jgi:hypothetical protein
MRCGQNHWDTPLNYIDPITGQIRAGVSARGTQFNLWSNPNRWSSYAGSAIDPIDGSMWAYGPYAGSPFDTGIGSSQWATFGANYKMSFPATDDYGNSYPFLAGYDPNNPANIKAYSDALEILRRHGMLKWEPGDAPEGAKLYEPPSMANFLPDATVTRRVMARIVVLSLMDQADVDELIPNDLAEVYFADVDRAGADKAYWKYIEVLARLGVVKGCYSDNVAIWNFCPGDNFSRGEMAVVIVRAKMNNIFPTLLNGCPATGGCPGNLAPVGDNYGFYQPGNPNANMTPHGVYFDDVLPTSVWNPFVQMMMALRVTTGTGPRQYTLGTSAAPALTRVQLAVFLARAFYY